MQSYPARLASFAPPSRRAAAWPHPPSYLATPASLAAAGFYFNPAPATPDAVSCFLCDKGLADWDPDDDPARIHADKCPKCPWALLHCVSDAAPDGSFSFASPSRLPGSRAIEKARLATFGPEAKPWWPHEAKNKGPNAKTMAKAGFVYTPSAPKDDTCICIYCRTELGGWQPDDDPMDEHRKRQSKNGPCPFFAKQPARSRSKSKPPPAPASDDETEHQPSTSTKKPKSKSKSSKKPMPLAEEVVEEYHVALDPDEDAPPKPRPKPRRGSSRASSRASTAESDASSSSKKSSASSKRSRSVSSSKKRTPKKEEESDSEPIPPSSSKRTPKNDTDAPPPSSKKRTPKDKPADPEPQSQPSTSKKPRSVSSSKKRTPKPKESDNEDLAPASKDKKSRNAMKKGKGKTVEDDSENESKATPVPVYTEPEPAMDDPAPELDDKDRAPPARKAKGKGKAPMQADTELIPPVEDPAPPVHKSEPKSRGKSKTVPTESDESEPARGRSKRVVKAHAPRTEDTPSETARGHAPKTNGLEAATDDAPAEDVLQLKPVQPNGIHHAPAFRSFQSPEDEEFAREEQALEAQARELMGADDLLTTPDRSTGKGKQVAHTLRMDADPALDKGKGKQPADTLNTETDLDPPPTPPPRTPSPPAACAAPSPTKFPAPLPASTLTALTSAERAMTVEQWVRHEMERQHAQLQHDGRTKIDAFKARAAEVARQIQGL